MKLSNPRTLTENPCLAGISVFCLQEILPDNLKAMPAEEAN
jgi:hypothetical protein